MTLTELAYKLRLYIEKASGSLADADAVEAMELFPTYEKLVAQNAVVERGFRFRYNGKLYRTEQPMHMFNGIYAPGVGTESLYSEVTLPGDGTQDKPIEYSGNMALENGKYYTQDGVVYLCNRDTGVPVYNALADLVGVYVVLGGEMQ